MSAPNYFMLSYINKDLDSHVSRLFNSEKKARKEAKKIITKFWRGEASSFTDDLQEIRFDDGCGLQIDEASPEDHEPCLMQYLDLSTAHLSNQTMKQVFSEDHVLCTSFHPEGAFIIVPEETPSDTPKDLARCLSYAFDLGAERICFDADGPLCNALPTCVPEVGYEKR